MLKTQGMLHFSLAVTDLDRSRKFYEGVLGLKVIEQSPRMVFLQTGDDYLILAKGNEPLKFDSSKSTPVHHAFRVKRTSSSHRSRICARTAWKYSTSRIATKVFSGGRRRTSSTRMGTSWRSTPGLERRRVKAINQFNRIGFARRVRSSLEESCGY